MYFRKSHVHANKLDVQETDFTHSATGLRMDGIPALDHWDLVIEIFHSPPSQTNETKDVREPR